MEEAMDEGLTTTPVVSCTFNTEEYGEIEIPSAPESVATYDINGPRLMISHIVNENFKSYAGVQTLGPFHKSFTSIVGPNGSGKSNVIDSMLFVFGYRANKIRSKKISVLIHNSQSHKDISSCTVAVHFQMITDTGPGDDEYTIVPNSKIVVSRTAFKDSSSQYLVDGKKSSYKDVAKLLRGFGIDLDHNRFLILQGEVEQIALMKPKALTDHEDGMLEFLEDIIGSNRFKEPIDILGKRVETLSEFRVEKLNRVKAVEKEKDALEGPKDEALQYLILENDISLMKSKLYQKYISEGMENEEKARVEFDKVNESMKDANEKIQVLSDAKKKKVKENQNIYKEYESHSKQCEDTKEKFSEFDRQDVKCREDIKHTKAKIKKLEKTLEQEKKKIVEYEAVPAESEKLVCELKKKLEQLEGKKKKEDEKLAEVMESLKTETKGMQEEKEKKEEELLALQKNVNETKSKRQVAQSELDIFLSNQQRETSKLKETEKNLAKTEASLKERKKELADLNRKLPQVEKLVTNSKKDICTATEAEAKATEQVRTLRRKVEETRDSLHSARKQGRVLEALMDQKTKGVIPGIFGRLGDLGAIDEKYDVAISTACGALDHIVVDSIDTAQRCVKFLKKNNVGVATFIGLEKMAKWIEHTKRKINTPESIPRLFDLVRVSDSSILPAFYFALRDTLVAKDLDQATRIAYGKTRYRVVTLQGQLIDQSGTMSGGGTSVCRGRMGTSLSTDTVDPKELANMENTLEKLTMEAQQCRCNREKLEDMIGQNEKAFTQMKHQHEKFTMEIKAMSEQEVALKSQKAEQEQRVKAAAPDEKHLKELEHKVAEYTKDYDKVASVASKIEDEVQSLHKQIMDIGGLKLQAVQSRVDAISNNIDQVTGQMTKANVAVKTAERNLKKVQDKVVSIEEEISESSQKLTTIDVQLKVLEEDATKVLQAYQKSQDDMKVIEESLSAIKKELAELEEEENKIEKETIDVRHEVEKFENLVKKNQAKVEYWKKELSRLKLHSTGREDQAKLVTLPTEELDNINKDNVQYEITVLEERLAGMRPNMAAVTEYKKKETLYLQRVSELDEITNMRDEQRKYYEKLRKQRLEEFMAGFTRITNKLKEMYQMITLGGDAELELVDSLDPFSEGIVFSVRPPKKSWKNISNLSGGEKTLSSLALVFALHHYKPTPLYVMDEIDAALDFKNVSIVANYIKERTKNAQFIIISLRNNMFELADRLVGIYKTNDCTKSVTINPHKLSLPLQEKNSTVM